MKFAGILILLVFQFCKSIDKSDPVVETQVSYFDGIQLNDIKLRTPVKGEWLYDHKEPGQTFDQYKRDAPVRITKDKFTIYLEPIGEFGRLQNEILKLTSSYLAIYFQQKVILLQPVSDAAIPKFARRTISGGNEQILASYVLDSMLKWKTPANGIVCLAICGKDLFPKADWNFVFGLASYIDRIGVSSIYRLQGSRLDFANFSRCLARTINICAHEIGHMFTLHHCIYAKCVMNGSNSLYETDLSPNRLCSQCQRKLHWNFQYDSKKRLAELNNYFKNNKLPVDFELSKRDLNATR